LRRYLLGEGEQKSLSLVQEVLAALQGAAPSLVQHRKALGNLVGAGLALGPLERDR
jgi:hypothetical protein